MTASIERIEDSGFEAWSPDETTTIAGWKISSSGGFTRRLNSASARGRADTSLATREAITTWLADRGAALTVRVTPLMDARVAEDCVCSWGLESVDKTTVLVRRPCPAGPFGDVVVVDAGDPAYTSDLFDLNRREPSVRDSWDRIVGRIGSQAIGLWIPGRAVAFAVVCAGISSVFSVAVAERDRRAGLATQIMSASAEWALDRGAEWQFVQVLGTNLPAIELYEGLGFTERYRYRYLQHPQAGHPRRITRGGR